VENNKPLLEEPFPTFTQEEFADLQVCVMERIRYIENEIRLESSDHVRLDLKKRLVVTTRVSNKLAATKKPKEMY
jgi:hypothetical protein